MDELRDRIAPMYEDMFKKMLGIEELPETLLRRYFSIKKMTDKVDARLSPADLARIALDVGFDPERRKFVYDNIFPAGEIPIATQDKSKPALESERTRQPDTDESKPDLPPPPSKDATEDEIKLSDEPIPNGTSVRVLTDDDVVSGKIAGSQRKGEDIEYTVETEDGKTITATRDDIDKV